MELYLYSSISLQGVVLRGETSHMSWCWLSWVLRPTSYELCRECMANGIAQWYSAGLRAGWWVVRVPAEAGNFSLHHRVQTGSGARPTSYTMGTRGLSLGVKRAGREADHSHPCSAEVKNACSCTSTLQYAFMVWCSVKAQGQLYLYLTVFFKARFIFRIYHFY
jgi:hypothetical protein